jgi:hypothetical protein
VTAYKILRSSVTADVLLDIIDEVELYVARGKIHVAEWTADGASANTTWGDKRCTLNLHEGESLMPFFKNTCCESEIFPEYLTFMSRDIGHVFKNFIMYLERSSGHIIMLFIEEDGGGGRYYECSFRILRQALDVLTRSSWVSYFSLHFYAC